MSEEKIIPKWCNYPNANSKSYAEGCWPLLGSDNTSLSRKECGDCEHGAYLDALAGEV